MNCKNCKHFSKGYFQHSEIGPIIVWQDSKFGMCLCEKAHPNFKEYTVKGKPRKLLVNHRGYLRIQLSHRGEYISVHRIVAKAFIHNPNNLPEVNHINGVKNDNRPENLEWCTRSENHNHALKNGLIKPKQGVEHWNSKLDEIQVKTILRCAADGMTGYKLAKYFKVSQSVVYNIIRRKTWRHL